MSAGDVFSQYKADGKLRFQERDCAKIWKDQNDEAVIALFCIENQVAVDKFLAVRVIGYDGAAYRDQLNKKSIKNGENITNEKLVIHPVLTLVLYFGEGEWTAPTTLYECMNVPEKLNDAFRFAKRNVTFSGSLPTTKKRLRFLWGVFLFSMLFQTFKSNFTFSSPSSSWRVRSWLFSYMCTLPRFSVMLFRGKSICRAMR